MLKILTITEGDTYFVRLPLLKEGQPWPIAGWKFWFTIKNTTADADPGLAQKTTDAGTIKQLTPTVAYVVGASADTKGFPGKFSADVQGKSPEGDIVTLERMIVIVSPEITKAA